MKKIITGLFFLFNISGHCFGLDEYNKNLKSLKQEINEIFEIRDEKKWKPIYLITVTRSSKDNEGNIFQNPTIKDTSEVKEILSEVSEKINQKCNDGHKIIVFNEMFFSQVKPLEFSDKSSPETVTHETVMECIKDFNNSITNSIVFCNLLYKTKRSISWDKALYLYALTLFRERKNGLYHWCHKDTFSNLLWNKINRLFNYSSSRLYLNKPKEIVTSYVDVHAKIKTDTFSIDEFQKTQSIKTITSKTHSLNTDFLVNRTYCIYQRRPIFFYNKSSYFRENDVLIQDWGYIYDLGDGYPTIINYLSDKAKKIFNTISTEICMDFACGIRKNNNWKSERKSLILPKLHIIQSNSVETWLMSRENYPFNTPILYSDANYCFPNFRMGLGGVTCCLELQKDSNHNKSLGKQTNLFNDVINIVLPIRRSSEEYGITDHYNIWICKI